MFTKFLFKPFLTFTLLALLLLPQIGETGTAFAAKPSAKFPTPVSLAIPGPDVCLSISDTAISNGHIIPLDNPPGEAVEFTINYDVMNNCSSTVGSIIIGGPVEGACQEGSVNLLKMAFIVNGDLASEQHVGDSNEENEAHCTVYNANGSATSEVPTGINMSLSAAGTDANGAKVSSPAIPLVVTW